MATSSASTFATGDVVVVPFPYSDRLAQKRRPAIVVSGNELHALGLIWVVMITSANHSAQPYDLPLADLAGAGLSAPSVARPTKIDCVEPAIIVRIAGRLDAPDTTALLSRLRTFLS